MRIKTIATLGPASMDPEIMGAMVDFGVRIFRLNFSHSDAATFEPVVKIIRDLESEKGIPLTAMGDLCGPKIRIGKVDGSPLTIGTREKVMLGPSDKKHKADGLVYISLDFPELLQGLEEGMPVSLSDGMLQFKVTRVVEKDVLFEMVAENEGFLSSHKGIAFPGKFHPMPALTAKDRKDLHEGLDIGLDAVALSFVQNRRDVEDIKSEIDRHGRWVPVISKLERKNALDNLDSIVNVSDAVMVARGDLGLECSLATLPVIQKRIIRACRHHQKGAIVATQMLLSMVNNPLPTRAETTDVANAIMDGADCVMLSEETAIGKYPVDVVRFIHGIAASAEAYYLERSQGPFPPAKRRDPSKYLSYAACLLAENLSSAALACHSTSGSTARMLSSRRPGQPIYALTPNPRVIHHLNFFFGVRPVLADSTIESHLKRVEKFVSESGAIGEGQSTVITSGQPTPGQMHPQTNQVKIYYK